MSAEKKNTLKQYLIRIPILLIGLTIAHLGVTLFLLSKLGSDPYNVLIQGLFRTFDSFTLLPLTHGTTHVLISLLIILILLLLDKHYIKIGTLLCMLFGGPIIDLFSILLSKFNLHTLPLPGRILILSAGCTILAVGMTIVINSEAGTGPNDLVAIVLSDKTKVRFSVMRVLVDSTFVITGFFLGGTLGVGTIICALLVGPIAGYFLPITKKIIQKTISGLFLK